MSPAHDSATLNGMTFFQPLKNSKTKMSFEKINRSDDSIFFAVLHTIELATSLTRSRCPLNARFV
jgi:hypothetical protein